MTAMTAAQRAASRMFACTLVLLVAYALISLVAALKFLPGDLTQTSLPYDQVGAFAAALLDLAALGGLLGGGIYAAGSDRQRTLDAAVRLWTLLVVFTIGAGVLNLLVSLAVIVAALKIGVIGLVIASLKPDSRAPIPQVWAAGMVVSAAATAVGLIPSSDYFTASALHTIASGTVIYIGYVLAAVALAFWLMHRFSNVTPLWAGMSLYTVAGLLALAGALITLNAVIPESAVLGTVTAIAAPLLFLLFASHSYRALSDRNPTNTLAAHWTAFGILLLLLGVGVLGGLQAPVRLWTAGTRLSDLQPMLALLAVVAISLGVINQSAAEMRGENRRVTGLAPFWLVAFGVIGGGLALAGAGLVQVYLERLLSIGYLDVQALLEPLHALWVGGLALVVLGVGWYAVVFWLRRPRP